MKIAVEGCAHGELERIYDTIQGMEQAENIKVDLLLCCGDFQSTRNLEDLQTMAVPQKYQDICTFYKYYSGELVAPIMTIFIGGNHEASNYLQELPYGGWVAPNIYYLGYAGVIRVNGLRIAGLSGIYKGHDFLRGRFEFSPYTDATRISVYHVRHLEVFRLKQLSGSVDICMSHDWPRGIYNFGNKSQLVRFKPHFRDEVDNNQLGSRPCEELLKALKPSYWFAAHLHCKFSAVVTHEEEDEPANSERITKFLALDKCLPKRRFLQLLDVDAEGEGKDDGPLRLEYDLEWLAILHLTNNLISVKNNYYYMPGPRSNNADEQHNFTPTDAELQNVRDKFDGDLRIPLNFCRTVEAYKPDQKGTARPAQPKAQINPQSTQFCDKLGLDDPVSLAMLIGGHELNHSITLVTTQEASDAVCPTDSANTLNLSSCSVSQASPAKRKSSLGLSLPKPLMTAQNDADAIVDDAIADEAMDSITANPDELPLNDGSAAEETDDGDTKDDHPVEVSESSSVQVPAAPTAVDDKPPIKKFKRRNEDIYKEDVET